MNRRLFATCFSISAFAASTAFSADLYDCSYLLQPNANGEAQCLCAEPIEQFTNYDLSSRQGDVRVVTANPYSESDPAIPLSVGDRVSLQSNASAYLSHGPTCARDLHGKASIVIREVGDGYTNVAGGSGADLMPGGTCVCAALVEEKVAGFPWVVPLVAVGAGLGIACLAGELGCDDDDKKPVSPH